ncbi:kinase-like domain-containing protein [Pavlovales sp. CCMP2436]|nr:kinase-like domain-containing protein [Pavlovales sp. CCMP2436]
MADDDFASRPALLRSLREIRCIGRGATGEAFLVQSEASGRMYCVKQIALSAEPSPDSLGMEVACLRRLDHPNVIAYHGAYVERSGGERVLRIVMEYADSGTLAQWLSARWGAVPEEERCGLISEDEIMSAFFQLVTALAHCENIMLHQDDTLMSLKLGDFGVSRILASTHAMANTTIGTPYYLSPEMV